MKKIIKKVFKQLEFEIKRLNKTEEKEVIEVTKKGFWKKRYYPGRSLKRAAEIFNSMGGKIIVELGTGLHGKASGDSVLVWIDKTNAERIICVDTDEKCLNEVKNATMESGKVEFVLGDGIKFLEQFSNSIDLLYLDFWAPDPKGTCPGTGRARAYLQAYLRAREKMSEKSLILIDDTDHIPPWKYTLIVPAARMDGFEVIWTGRQTLLRRQFVSTD
jgi:predicted O-methyltransferase YrrM